MAARAFDTVACLVAFPSVWAGGLALWSLGVALGRSGSLSLASLLLAQAVEAMGHRLNSLRQQLNSMRQQLREWYYPAAQKRGKQRRELDEATLEACFGPLLRWVLTLSQEAGPEAPRQLALALDATTLQDRFVVLCISVLYRGSAIPVAWTVLPAQPGQSWRPHWLRLLRRLQGAVPASYDVLRRDGAGGPRLVCALVVPAHCAAGLASVFAD